MKRILVSILSAVLLGSGLLTAAVDMNRNASISLDVKYISTENHFDSDGKSKKMGFTSTELRLPITARWSPIENLNLGLVLPIVSREIFDDKGSGIGDIDLLAGYEMINESDEMFGLDGMLSLTLPTGKNPIYNEISYNESGLGGPIIGSGYGMGIIGGSYNLGAKISASKKIESILISAYLGYLLTLETPASKIGNWKYDFGDSISYGLYGAYMFDEKTSLGLEINGVSTSKVLIDGIEMPKSDSYILTITPILGLNLNNSASLQASLSIPLAGKNEINGIIFNVGMAIKFDI